MPDNSAEFEVGIRDVNWDESAPTDPHGYGTRTFDLYGWKEGNLETIKLQVEAALNLSLEWYESGYRMTEYYGCLTSLSEEIRLTRNINVWEQLQEFEYPEKAFLLYIWRTQRSSELENRIIAASQATLLRREELPWWCSDGVLNEFASFTIANLVKYGKLDKAEAQRRVEARGWFSREFCDTKMSCALAYHEIPYYWAMCLLYDETHPYWWNNPELNVWPPPWGANVGTGLTDEEEEMARAEVQKKGWDI